MEGDLKMIRFFFFFFVATTDVYHYSRPFIRCIERSYTCAYILHSSKYYSEDHTKQNVGPPRRFATWLLLPSRSYLTAPLKGRWFEGQKVESRNEQR